MFTLAVLLYSTTTADAGCDADTITSAVDGAEQAFVGGDLRQMDVALGSVRRSLACVREPIPPTLCAAVHRTYALHAWLGGDESGAIAGLRAMLHADPYAMFPDPLIPAQHPLRYLLVQAEESAVQWTRAPGSGWVLVDGLRTGAAPVGQPYILQVIKTDGKTGGARLIRSNTEGAIKMPLATKRAFRWTGIGLGVLSASLYGGAWSTNRAYHRAVLERDNARIGSLHTTTNTLSIGSLAAVGLGVGGIAFSELYFE